MDSPVNAIDMHAHIYPARYLDFLEEIGVDPATTAIARNINADDTEADMAKRLEWMDRAGVATQVLAATPQIPSVADPDKSAQAARMINDIYADVVARYPGRFLALGSLPLPHVEESIAEIGRIFDELHFHGIAFPTVLPGGLSIADPQLDPIWEELDRRGALVNIHATGSGAHTPMITDFWLTWVNGAPMEDAIATLQLMKKDHPNRFPHVRLHIAHLAGDLAFLSQRIEDNYTDWDSFASSPREMLHHMYYDAANFHEPSLRLAVETYGDSQIMAGSDIPYFQEDKYVRAFDYIRTAKLDDDVKAKILRGNAQALLGL
ncbi:putative TIM-barrel fold metal-dependent hydrolase [Arcanobacterium wilhelmae]|uniref:TIM-barrel fold metal-dependent hydrolase n=2 Tax=Arcanobacterium wilhelmae TaxID=1803177 RepID=A0ABT9NAN2_9ACTO|nr:amidohydrolase family protein [Arcanobacterium wilhelmae]MDP9800747.1 putative TIM-barrel fold metal-dependent hydrolase [Arcanobacterium wilhelmae]WFN90145.1 amidohydrolase family protein [Arcanobacterium wilhelmae]